MSSSGGPSSPSLPGTPRIVFVDDDPLILRSILRALRGTEPGWNVVSFEDPVAALESFAEAPPDVVVSDLNMSRLDGAEFLSRVQRDRPEAVRVVLSAMVDSKQIFRAVPVAHQFVTKPFEVRELRDRLRSALELSELLVDRRLRAIVAADSALPTTPGSFEAISRVVSRPDANLAEIVAVIERDMALTAELTRLVSSAFFGLPRQVHTVRGAVAYLGVEMLKALVLQVDIVRTFRPDEVPGGFDMDELQSHALLTARAMRKALVGTRHADDAFTAGALHDIGQLVLASRAPRAFGRALELAERERLPLADAERRVLGVTHAEVGAYLLGLWGVRQSVVEAVALHHETGGAIPGSIVAALRSADANDAATSEVDPPRLARARPSGFVRVDAEPRAPSFFGALASGGYAP